MKTCDSNDSTQRMRPSYYFGEPRGVSIERFADYRIVGVVLSHQEVYKGNWIDAAVSQTQLWSYSNAR